MDNTVQQTQTINPLLSRVQMPGETFTLPSGGLFYVEGILDPSVENAELHVHPMTAIDEIVMKTPDLLFTGKAVQQVFARCIPQVLDATRLLSKDVDFLLACLRKVSYGDEMEVEYRHTCENAQLHSYTIDITKFMRKTKKIDPTTVAKKFTVDLPNGQKVKLKPVTFGQYIHMMQVLNANTEENETPEKVKNELLIAISDLIISVDEVNDRGMIIEWLDQVPAGYIDQINNNTEENTGWGIDFITKVKCKDCGEMVEISASVNPLTFFT